MAAAPLPSDEGLRLSALSRICILDSPPEPIFDEIVREAAKAAGTPIALISFISERSQWFKASIGLDIAETSRDSAFCAWAIHDAEVMWIEDASKDDRFSDNPLVHGHPNIRHYAGAPISTPDGYLLGSLCVIDRVPRPLNPDVIEKLQNLSQLVSEALERRTSRELSQPGVLAPVK